MARIYGAGRAPDAPAGRRPADEWLPCRGETNGGDDVADHPGVEALLLDVTVEAQRALLRARHPEQVVEALEGAVHRLGGSIVPGHLGGDDVLPLDVSLGVHAPAVPWVPSNGPSRAHLERVLPGLVEDARATVHRLRTLHEAVGDPTDTDPVTGGLDPAATVRLVARLGAGDALAGLALRDADAIAATHGRTRVEVLLHELGTLLRSELDLGDHLGRLDGPALVGVLLRTDVGRARELAERVARRWQRQEPDTPARTAVAGVGADGDGELALASVTGQLDTGARDAGAWLSGPLRGGLDA
jgi:hypothetical protein